MLLCRLDDFEATLPLSKDIEVDIGDCSCDCDWLGGGSLNRERALLVGSLIEERFSSVCCIISSVYNLWLELYWVFLEALVEFADSIILEGS